MNTFTPHAGQVFAKSYNDGIKVLVITPMTTICNNGWFCLGLPIYRNGSYGRVMIVSVHADDRLLPGRCKLPAVAVEALHRHRAIQRRARAAYVADDSYDTTENGKIIYMWGGI